MAEDVDVAVIGPHFEALIANAIPLVKDFFDLVLGNCRPPGKREAQRPLVRPISRVSLDSKHHIHGQAVKARHAKVS